LISSEETDFFSGGKSQCFIAIGDRNARGIAHFQYAVQGGTAFPAKSQDQYVFRFNQFV